MNNNRRGFLKLTGMSGLAMATGWDGLASSGPDFTNDVSSYEGEMPADENISIIGQYGKWGASLIDKVPSLSFRNQWASLETWRSAARKRLAERLGIPDLGPLPQTVVTKQSTYDGLYIEELTWQLPYGRPTRGILLKPQGATQPLPGILAFHDHGGNKFFGCEKIARTGEHQHPVMEKNQQTLYENLAWANEIAKRGYVVLASDAFAFGSRRVMLQDVPDHVRKGLTDPDLDNLDGIKSYNDWAGQHEHIMSKALFSAGTTWPGVFFAEDQKALDILCARPDVDPTRVGCCGLSGGGLRTVMMGGLDSRIKCAVGVGFMTTWRDFLLNKATSHTWMTYVPILPNELDFPEILSLRAPEATMVLNDSEDQLFTLSEMQRADNILREVFHKAKADDRYRCSFHPGPHKFDAKMQTEAFNWFDRWLKK
jgi:dienelactone hydrolase